MKQRGLFFTFLLAIGLIALSLRHVSESQNISKIYYAVPESTKYFTFGYSDVMADSAWVRVLQDIDVCEQHNHVTTRIGPNRIATCKDGWVYHMIDLVMTLAPRWRLPQRVGPMVLSVIVDDRDGATKLFDKAVKNFPNDWPILTRAGYHYLFEDQDYFKAAKVYEAASKQPGAPEWCKYLAGKLFEKSGRLEVAKLVLEDFLKRTGVSQKGRELAKAKLAEVNRKLDELQKEHPPLKPNKSVKSE